MQAVTPPPEDDDPFWSPDDVVAGEPGASAITDEFVPSPLEGIDDPIADLGQPAAPAAESEPPPPPGKNDYLANARKAAQAQRTDLYFYTLGLGALA